MVVAWYAGSLYALRTSRQANDKIGQTLKKKRAILPPPKKMDLIVFTALRLTNDVISVVKHFLILTWSTFFLMYLLKLQYVHLLAQ